MSGSATAIWHDVECAGYAADLALWEQLAERCGGPVLELGCGTGRVALHLARRGHRLIGLDRDAVLVETLAARAGSLPVEVVCAEATEFALPGPAALALAPMQFLQLLPGAAERLACLRCVGAALVPGALLAAAIVEDLPDDIAFQPPLPDVREVDGWVYSSLPVAARSEEERIVLRRLRQTVAPDGGFSEEEDEIQLRSLATHHLEEEAGRAGFAPAGRRAIAATDAHVGSSVVLLERSE